MKISTLWKATVGTEKDGEKQSHILGVMAQDEAEAVRKIESFIDGLPMFIGAKTLYVENTLITDIITA